MQNQCAKYKVNALHITPTNTHYYTNTQYKEKDQKQSDRIERLDINITIDSFSDGS